MKSLVVAGVISVSILAAQNADAVPLPGRTFVASTGLDTNPCSRTAPCRSFAAAITVTAAGGEVIVLDSAGYGPVTISNSISLVSPSGVYAGITVTSGNGVTVSSGASLTLRGLTINGVGGTNGVVFNSGGYFYLQGLTIQNFSLDGIVAAIGSSTGVLRIEDTTILGSGGDGVFASGIPGIPQQVLMLNCRLEDNGTGLDASPGSAVTVERSVAVGNGTGFYANSGDLTIDDSVASSNFTGLHSNGSGRVARTLITANTYGVVIENTKTLDSFGDNHLAFNTTDGAFSNTLPLH
jgi:hypothetical protein